MEAPTYEEYLEEAKKENSRLIDAIKQSTARNLPKGVVPAKKQIIALCTPTLGMASFWWFGGVMHQLWPMNTTKAVLPMLDKVGRKTGIPEIAELRNRCVQTMLALENEHTTVEGIFWLDDDVIVGPSALCALLRHEADIVSGVYFCKGDLPQPLLFGGPSSGTVPFIPCAKDEGPGSTMPIWGWAQGLSYTRMEVYKRVRDELDIGTDKYGAPLWYEPNTFKVVNGQVMQGGTEDFPFFEKVARLGYQPIVDLTHHAFGYHYDAANDIGYPKAQWEQWSNRLPVVWPANRHRKEEVVWPNMR